jgi:hypothetical protein
LFSLYAYAAEITSSTAGMSPGSPTGG